MNDFFKIMKEKVFGKKKSPDSIARHDASAEQKNYGQTTSAQVHPETGERPVPIKREPYFVQIGLDFGTAYCKCVCRDVLLDKAWIHYMPGNENAELPFLITSTITLDCESLQHAKGTQGTYVDGCLHHTKMALQKVALKKMGDPLLLPFDIAKKRVSEKDLARFVETCAIYLIGGILGNVKREINSRFPGKVAGDYEAVNMAVPVADANHPDVNSVFDRVLQYAWVLADELAGHPPTPYSKLLSSITRKTNAVEENEVGESCFSYPEVSASVQGFVRSRTSSPGLYLFSDTGAGTVDQSVFLFNRGEGGERLAYLHAEVYPLGSSFIEKRAAMEDGDESLVNLERFRQLKEAGEQIGPLVLARRWGYKELKRGTNRTIAWAKKKLNNPNQINQLRIIFGGGGHCENPYRAAVLKQFDDGNQFLTAEINRRRIRGDSFDLGMPIPRDLPLQENQKRWMNRLTVAYGLSFEKGQLADFTLPRDVPFPDEEEIWRPIRHGQIAPTHDDV